MTLSLGGTIQANANRWSPLETNKVESCNEGEFEISVLEVDE